MSICVKFNDGMFLTGPKSKIGCFPQTSKPVNMPNNKKQLNFDYFGLSARKIKGEHMMPGGIMSATGLTDIDYASSVLLADFNIDLLFNTSQEREMILNAAQVTKDGHQGQFRKDGSEYYTHPKAVAYILWALGLDAESITAGLLHDIIEQGEIAGERVTDSFLQERFNKTITFFVEGLTELGKEPEYDGEVPSQEAIHRKILKCGLKDIRIILVKFADRLHNLLTIRFKERENQIEKAVETRDLYAPLADRLGIWFLKRLFEDLVLFILNESKYRNIKERRLVLYQQSKKQLDKIVGAIGFEKVVAVVPEVRWVNEIVERMGKRGIKEVGDLSATDIWRINLNVNEEKDCYEVLRLLHEKYDPVQGEFRDYIGGQLPNRHRFLHTYIEVPEFGRLLVQIRDRKGWERYQLGIITEKDKEGWYKENPAFSDAMQRIIQETEGRSESEASQIVSAYTAPIVVYTKDGQKNEIGSNSTVLDYVRLLGEERFLHLESVHINSKPASLYQTLSDRDRIEEKISDQAHPVLEWIDHINTSEAEKSLQKYLNRNVNQSAAMDYLDSKSKKLHLPARELVKTGLFSQYCLLISKSEIDVLEDIATGKIRASKMMRDIMDLYYSELEREINDWKELVEKKIIVKNDEPFRPFYISIETIDEKGQLRRISEMLEERGFNINQNFIYRPDPNNKMKVKVVIGVDVFGGNFGGMVGEIQRLQVKTLAGNIGKVANLLTEEVHHYLKKVMTQLTI
ncbi:HD domain-containing protein [Candidatus Margulisiibacteriota bacterium]